MQGRGIINYYVEPSEDGAIVLKRSDIEAVSYDGTIENKRYGEAVPVPDQLQQQKKQLIQPVFSGFKLSRKSNRPPLGPLQTASRNRSRTLNLFL